MKFRTLIGAVMLALSATAFAAAPTPPNVQVEHAWIRWLPAKLPAAGYAVIRNVGDEPLRLTGVSSPDYGMVMLHHSRLAQGDSTMEMVDHLDIPAHGSVELAPGGYHLMLSQPTHTIEPGDHVKMTLEFAGGDKLQTDFSVRPANASGPGD
ncbi:MAG TPA: copper chaperone PCu(A)C [Rhodanobacteraceae bacterium]|nr:copper chaperone PCu(A)C [Rhodanobacteraceae bacterium]